MNAHRFLAERIGERAMPHDGRRLQSDSIAILRRFDPRALIIAAATTLIMLLLLRMHPLLALVLGTAVYAGVALLWEKPATEASPAEPPTPEEESFQRVCASTATMLELAKEIEDLDVRERVVKVGNTVSTMLEVMEKDKDQKRYASAPDFEVHVVVPFIAKLTYYIRLTQRRIGLAAPHLQQFEQVELRRYESLSNSFYQHYHDGDVIDFVALLEMFEVDENDEDEEVFADEFDFEASSAAAHLDLSAVADPEDDEFKERAS